jgi:hypothetical protein
MLGRFVNYRQLLDQIDQLLDAITKEIMAFRAERARIQQDFIQSDLRGIGKHINWGADPDLLRAGDLSRLDQAVATAIENAAKGTGVIAAARNLGVSPVSLVVGLIAQIEARKDRTAARIAKAILANASGEDLKAVNSCVFSSIDVSIHPAA